MTAETLILSFTLVKGKVLDRPALLLVNANI